MVDKEQPLSNPLNKREFLASAAGAGTGLLGLSKGTIAKENEVNRSNKGKKAKNWKLKYHENFGRPLPVDSASWVRDPLGKESPWYVDELSDDGELFKIRGGDDFERHLDSFDILRKRVPFGKDDWLTAELAARDYEGDGEPKTPPSLHNVTLPNGGRAARLEVPHDSGLLIRPTNALPSQYRIECTLRTISFGGERNGSLKYDGKFNGYDTEGVKTNWPWKNSGDFSGPADMSNNNFSDVRQENGCYFLSIMDYPNPAPHNNVFIHNHRKVNMDAYNTNAPWADSYAVCNPATKELYNYTAPKSTYNGINQLYINGSQFRNSDIGYTDYIIETECGTFTNKPEEPSIVSTAEIKPELMPKEAYQFAIERDETGYAMEMTGNFRYIGQATLRYHRDFIQNGLPIWHYNNTSETYDGQFDQVLTYSGPYGSFSRHEWPEDSAYPDYFIIGEPHMNYYEGEATVDNIRLYT